MATSTGESVANAQETGANPQETGANAQETEWVSSMETMLRCLTNDKVKTCSIFGVPEHLRKWGKEAYEPKVVSIGPLHRTKREFLYMEEIKYRCLLSLLQRTGNETQRFPACSNHILRLNEVVRAFYVDDVKFNNYELAKIMILDGCFLLELLISYAEQSNPVQSLKRNIGEEPIDAFSLVREMGDIHSDLKLIENQIPLTVLIWLFHLLFTNDGSSIQYESIRNTINCLALFFFGCTSSLTTGHCQNRGHLLELVHTFMTEKEDGIVGENTHHSITITTSEKPNYKTTSQLNRCAVRLKAAGFTIMPAEEQIKGTKLRSDQESSVVFGCYTSFRDKTLKIQPLNITEETVIMWQNLIAWEQNRITHEKYLDQNHGRTSCEFSEFALLFKGLICCEDDIELLKKLNVLVVRDEKKWSNEKLMIFFRTIHRGIQIDASEDSENGQKIMSSSSCRENVRIFRHNCRCIVTNVKYTFRKWFVILKRDHTPTVWKTIGVIAAVVLLLLTVSQTVLADIAT